MRGRDGQGKNAFLQQRLATIARNQAKMAALGLQPGAGLALGLGPDAQRRPPAKRKRRARTEEAEVSAGQLQPACPAPTYAPGLTHSPAAQAPVLEPSRVSKRLQGTAPASPTPAQARRGDSCSPAPLVLLVRTRCQRRRRRCSGRTGPQQPAGGRW